MKFAELSVLPAYFKWQWPKDPATFNIVHHLRCQLSLYDFDSCGEETTFHVVQTFDDVKFYRCFHEWSVYWEMDEWQPRNDFEIKEVSKEEMLAEDPYGYIKQNLTTVV